MAERSQKLDSYTTKAKMEARVEDAVFLFINLIYIFFSLPIYLFNRIFELLLLLILLKKGKLKRKKRGKLEAYGAGVGREW